MQKQNQEFMKLILNKLDSVNKPLQIEQDYYSIQAYANNKQIKLTFTEAKSYGKMAATLSKKYNLDIRYVPDERWGKVGSYDCMVLQEVFNMDDTL